MHPNTYVNVPEINLFSLSGFHQYRSITSSHQRAMLCCKRFHIPVTFLERTSVMQSIGGTISVLRNFVLLFSITATHMCVHQRACSLLKPWHVQGNWFMLKLTWKGILSPAPSSLYTMLPQRCGTMESTGDPGTLTSKDRKQHKPRLLSSALSNMFWCTLCSLYATLLTKPKNVSVFK